MGGGGGGWLGGGGNRYSFISFKNRFYYFSGRSFSWLCLLLFFVLSKTE